MTVGERIRQRRQELGLTQEELANKLGNKSRASVCTVEKDKEDLTTDRVRKYAAALECTPAFLLGWETIDGKTIENPKPDPKRIERALELYEQFAKCSPDVQSAVKTLLKSSQLKP